MTPRFPHPARRDQTDPEREARHRVIAELLAAYADQELPSETAAQIDAHLVGCLDCRRALAVQAALRDRLADEPVRPAPPALRDRIAAAVRTLPAPSTGAPVEGASADDDPVPASPRVPVAPALMRRRQRVPAGRWLAGALLATVVALAGGLAARRSGALGAGRDALPPAPSAGSATLDPVVGAALADYRRTMASELPGSADELLAVRARLPFPVAPLAAPDAHLVAAWVTTLRGEPAAALAYRWGQQVIVQYVVSERIFFGQPAVRRAVALRRVYAVTDGEQGVLGWAEPANGVLLVGDAPPADLARARGGAVAF